MAPGPVRPPKMPASVGAVDLAGIPK